MVNRHYKIKKRGEIWSLKMEPDHPFLIISYFLPVLR